MQIYEISDISDGSATTLGYAGTEYNLRACNITLLAKAITEGKVVAR